MAKSKHIEAGDLDLLNQLQEHAEKHHDGHLTICKFTTNWRVGFVTPTDRDDIIDMAVGITFSKAAIAALAKPVDED